MPNVLRLLNALADRWHTINLCISYQQIDFAVTLCDLTAAELKDIQNANLEELQIMFDTLSLLLFVDFPFEDVLHMIHKTIRKNLRGHALLLSRLCACSGTNTKDDLGVFDMLPRHLQEHIAERSLYYDQVTPPLLSGAPNLQS